MTEEQEHVVLIEEDGSVAALAPKSSVHTRHTPLHRAFSVFLFNERGEVLLQQRSRHKKTWPLVWSGSCCGHPQLHEKNEQAVRRRVLYELGVEVVEDVACALPHFRYRCERDGIVENELCPVFLARIKEEPYPNSQEVEAYKWTDWNVFTSEIIQYPSRYSEWCGLQVRELIATDTLCAYTG